MLLSSESGHFGQSHWGALSDKRVTRLVSNVPIFVNKYVLHFVQSKHVEYCLYWYIRVCLQYMSGRCQFRLC